MSGFADIGDAVLGACMDAFGEPVTYQAQAAGTGPVATTAVFDNGFFERETFSESGAPGRVTGSRPMAAIQLSALPAAPVQGDTLTARGTAYRVTEVQPDGHGGARLMLTRSS